MGKTILQLSAIAKNFGGLKAVDIDDLTVEAGSITALIGANGAGKSTLMNLIGGQLAADQGDIYLKGVNIKAMPTPARTKAGLARSFQIAGGFSSLSGTQALGLALAQQSPTPVVAKWFTPLPDGVTAKANSQLGVNGIDNVTSSRQVRHWAYGQKKWLDILLAINSQPDLLLLDEPAAGLSPDQRVALHKLLKAWVAADSKRAIFYCEHDMDMVFGLADKLVVMDGGHIIAAGAPETVRQDPKVRRAYLGEMDAEAPTKAAQSRPIAQLESTALLQLNDCEIGYQGAAIMAPLSASFKAGRCYGIMARNGSGKSTLAQSLMGFLPLITGQVSFDGQPMAGWNAQKRAASGFGYVPQNRRLFPELTVLETLKLAGAANKRSAWPLAKIWQLFPRLQERAGQKAATLSGGEQQMLAIARALSTSPKILILDEATEGLAPQIIDQLLTVIGQIRDMGLCVLMFEQNFEVLRKAGDEFMVLTRAGAVYQGDGQKLSRDPSLLKTWLAP